MLALSYAPSPAARPAAPPPDLGEALQRAHREARASGAFLEPPFAFHRLSPEAAAAVAPRAGGGRAWVLVTVRPSDDAGHRAHTRERCLTAAQRFMLQLACDDVDSVWVAPEPGAVRAAGLDIGDGEPVGLIRCG